MADRPRHETRALLLAPTATDSATCQALRTGSGIACDVCRDLADVCARLAEGAGAVVLPEEAVLGGRGKALAKALADQPPWSSLPVLVLTAAGPDAPGKVRAILELGDVTLLKRPLEVGTFVNAVQVALRDRERQYLVRDQLAELQRAQEALRASEEELRESARQKDEFLAMLGHELRNPLLPLRGALETLQRRHLDGDGQERAYAMMDRQVKHLTRLVDDLLDVSRITRGLVELRKEPVDLAGVSDQAIEMA